MPSAATVPEPDASVDVDVVSAFIAAARSVPADAPTACPGWVAHDVLAHVVAGGAEIGRLVGERIAGGADGPTTAFETREPPFRAVPYDQLVDLVAAGVSARCSMPGRRRAWQR
jgi:uncharacterized protein (TIGR03083 family)